MARKSPSLCIVVAFAAVAAWATGADAYSNYDPGCAACHGAFTDDTSPKGTVFPSNSKHEMHRASADMGTTCLLCHTTIGDNPSIGSSAGTVNNTGVGCVGCHGRQADAGHDTLSPGRGAGLRQHHWNAGVEVCGTCHGDANPADYTPVAESVSPQYYGTVDTRADSPCNPTAASQVGENWSVGDFEGIDNDGNGLYDTADPACAGTTTTSGPPATSTSTTTPGPTTTSPTSTTSTTTVPPGLIPGGGPTKSDCYVEAAVDGITNPSSRVQKSKMVLVTDGDVGDQGACGDEKCVIRVALCINQTDRNLPDCTPPAQLDRAKVKGKLSIAVPQLLVGPACGLSADVEVRTKVKRDENGDVKKAKAGKAKFRLSGKAPKGTTPRTDNDTVTLVCVPRTVACPSPNGTLLH